MLYCTSIIKLCYNKFAKTISDLAWELFGDKNGTHSLQELKLLLSDIETEIISFCIIRYGVGFVKHLNRIFRYLLEFSKLLREKN